jgi:hypothetical protein
MIDRRRLPGLSPDEWTAAAVRSLPADSFAQVLQATAVLFSMLKAEAIRRGVWDDLKIKKVTR